MFLLLLTVYAFYGFKWKAEPGAGHVPTMKFFAAKGIATKGCILGFRRGLWYALDSCYYIFQKPSETLKIIKLSFSYKNVMLFNGRIFYIRSSDLNLIDSKKDVANKDTSLVLSKFRV